MKRNSMMAFLLVSLLIIATACSGAEADGNDKPNESKENIILKFATSQPETHAMTEGALKPYMEKVTELTDGQVEFEFYPAEQLGKIADLLDLTRDGVTDIGFYYTSYYGSQMPITGALAQIPGLYTTSYEGSMAFHELSKQDPILDTDYLKNGVRPIFTYAAPSSEFWTRKKEIKVPEDLKRTKVRVSGELANQAVAALDASPLNITIGEMYEGFERSVFDVANMNPATMNDYGLGELIEFGTYGVNFGGSLTGLIINEKVFQSLPENVQEVLIQVGDEMTESNAKYYDEYNEEVIQEFKDSGIIVHELSEEEKAQWNKFYDEVEKTWVQEQKDSEFEKTLDAFKEEVKKYN